MIQRENHFQYLAALAVAGQISDIELEELVEHTASCGACSQRMVEMESTNFQLFLTLAAQIKQPKVSSRMQERFLIRAANSGVPMAAPSSGFRHSNFLHCAALLVAVCLFSGLGWRQATRGSLRQPPESTTSGKSAASAQLLGTANSGLVLSKAPVVRRAVNGPTRRNHHAASRATILPSFGMGKEPRVAARTLFHFNDAFVPNQPRNINSGAKIGILRDVSGGYFSPRGEGLKPSFSTQAIWSSNAGGVQNQPVFHYRTALASVSLQDDQAVFGLKPRVRDLSFSNMLDSNRSR